MEKKEIVAIQWNSSQGRVEFRERYADGSVGPIETTSHETDDPGKFRDFKRKTEKERLGRIIN